MMYVRNITKKPALCRIDGKDWKLVPGTVYPVPDDFRFDSRIFERVTPKESKKIITPVIEDANEAGALKDALKILTQESRILHKEKDKLVKENMQLKEEKKDLEEKLQSLSNKIAEKKVIVEVPASKKNKLKME